MPTDLGPIGRNGNETKALKIGTPQLSPSGIVSRGGLTRSIHGVGIPAMRLQSLTAGTERLAWGGEELTIGGPTPPSIRFDASGRKRFHWLLKTGTRTISVNVIHAINRNPRPSLFIGAYPSLGIPTPVEAFAPAGTGQVMIGPIVLNITTQGVVWVELRNNLVTNVGFSPCYFDHIVRT